MNKILVSKLCKNCKNICVEYYKTPKHEMYREYNNRYSVVRRGNNPGGKSHYKRYTKQENEMILNSNMTDVKLCKALGRSLEAISTQRRVLLGTKNKYSINSLRQQGKGVVK